MKISSLTSLKVVPKTESDAYFRFELETLDEGGKKKVHTYRVRHVNSRKKWFEMVKAVWLAEKYNNKLNISKDFIVFIDDKIGIIQELKKGKEGGKPSQETKSTENKSIENKNRARAKTISIKNFKILELLGTGAFSTVYKVLHLFSDKVYAMKVMNKNTLIRNKHFHYMITEYNILKQLTDFPFILTLHYAFQTANYLYMVMDFCSGGDFTNLKWINSPLLFMAELVLAFEHIHSKDIIYRDLKPENILLDNDGHIKLCDFNLGKEGIKKGERAYSFCGSPMYLSPEMIKQEGVGKEADIYGIGLIMYEILSGKPAFEAGDPDELFKKIQNNNINFDGCGFDFYQRDLLTKILVADPSKRPTIEEIKEHKFFEKINWDRVYNKKCGKILIEKDEEKELAAKQKISQKKEEIIEVKEIKSDYKREMKNCVRNFKFIRREEITNVEEFSVNLKVNLNLDKINF